MRAGVAIPPIQPRKLFGHHEAQQRRKLVVAWGVGWLEAFTASQRAQTDSWLATKHQGESIGPAFEPPTVASP